ncbi:MAG: S1 RNA-binding domain-containing protein [Aigarchaeota archaeon]|nr:S1 RNA-binding domain-containing protein [Candidatus Pelearchaeum maunauluense]
MTEQEAHLPEIGELVVGKVMRIDRFAAYLILEDYPGVEAFVHISEISLKWVRNIRDYLREGQRDVFKVIRINPKALQVDVSLRRVSQRERTDKILAWKRKQKVAKILSTLRERAGISDEEIAELIKKPLGDEVDKIYDVFEKISEGEPASSFLPNLPEKIMQELEGLVRQKIKHKIAVIQGDLVMKCNGRNGAEAIRTTAREIEGLAGKKEEVSITVKGSPHYLLRIKAADQERAEELLEEVLRKAEELMKGFGGSVEFKRG